MSIFDFENKLLWIMKRADPEVKEIAASMLKQCREKRFLTPNQKKAIHRTINHLDSKALMDDLFPGGDLKTQSSPD